MDMVVMGTLHVATYLEVINVNVRMVTMEMVHNVQVYYLSLVGSTLASVKFPSTLAVRTVPSSLLT